jgi:hypothetical protein
MKPAGSECLLKKRSGPAVSGVPEFLRQLRRVVGLPAPSDIWMA